MYFGEVIILQDRVNEFMDVAKELHVKELIHEGTDYCRSDIEEVSEDYNEDAVNETRRVSSNQDEFVAFITNPPELKVNVGSVLRPE